MAKILYIYTMLSTNTSIIADDNLLTFNLKGSTLQAAAAVNGNKIKIKVHFSQVLAGAPWEFNVILTHFRTSQLFKNTILPLAQRNDEGYRYGFSGMEKDDEMKGSGNSYTTTFRQYDARIGRFFSIDPAFSKYPNQSPYSFSLNNPINLNDPEGDDPIPNCEGGECEKLIKTKNSKKKPKPLLRNLIYSQIIEVTKKETIIMSGSTSIMGLLGQEKINLEKVDVAIKKAL